MSNKKQTKVTNGVGNILTPDMEAIRQGVVMDELKARHWKAQYEIAYYHLELEKILPSYNEMLDKKRAEAAEEEKKRKEFFEKLQAEQNLGELKVEEVGPNIDEMTTLSVENIE